MKSNIDSLYWNSKYNNLETGWDLNGPTPFFKKIMHSISQDKTICFPGAGYGHDPIYFANNGYNVFAIDYAKAAVDHMEKVKNSNLKIINSDFFDLDKKYNFFFDIVIEYTFFCAIHPRLRSDYFKKLYMITKDKSEIIGLFLPLESSGKGPPFKICLNEIEILIKDKFVIKEKYFPIESIEPRRNNEIFLRMVKIEN